MKEILDLIKTMTEYFQSQMTPQSFLDLLVQYVIPILQAIVLVGGAGAGIYKYYQSKNREINEKILSTVYAPLYNYFVKQELYCNLKGLQRDVKQTPILEISSTRVKTKLGNGKVESTREKFSVLNLDRKEFINVLHSVNIGLLSWFEIKGQPLTVSEIQKCEQFCRCKDNENIKFSILIGAPKPLMLEEENFSSALTGSRSPAGPRRLGTATRMSASLFRRLSAFFGSIPGQDPKTAKYAVLTPGPGKFVNVQLISRVVIAPPSEIPLFRRVCPCVRSYWRRRVCTRFRSRKRTWAVCARS